MPRTQSPYQGATGPSHPYGMYPQDIGMTRTPSVATNSTVGMPERSYVRAHGPTHPYGMYSQNTVPEGDVSPIVVENPSIPVGFPGLAQNYQRRLGPEGEEAADIIGPDGHTEQLPPYTRYPDGIAPKPTPPAMTNTFMAPVNPETSQDTLQSTQSPLSATRSNASEASGTRLNVAAADAANQSDESGSFKERWTEKGKRRMCHGKLPMWLVVVIVIVLVFAGALLGGIIGRVIGRRRAEQSQQAPAQALQTTEYGNLTYQFVMNANIYYRPPTITVTATSLIDATPLPSPPTNLPSLPSGSFGVPLGAPIEASHDCLTNASQNNAWSCGLGGFLGMAISTQSNGGNQVQLIDGSLSGGQPRYGAQPPVLNQPYDLMVMLDRADINRGPAFFFQQYYDKLVIVPERKIGSGPSKRSTRNGPELEERGGPGGWYDGEVAQPGHRPWFCFWNNTLLEGFIYITQNSTSTCLNSTSTSIAAPTSSTLTSAMRPSPPPMNPYPPIPTMSAAAGKRQIPSSVPPHYPKVIKIEERRQAEHAVGPYCQQMQVLNDGSVGQVTNQSGDLVIVHLNETEPSQQKAVKASKKRSWWDNSNGARLEQRDDMAGSCHCVWVSE